MPETVMLQGLKPFIGKHCETSALKRVLDYHGLSFSEEMLLGLGGGIGFIYWYMKQMPSPFVGCRNGKVPDFLITACKRIGAEISIFETTSAQKGDVELRGLLKSGEPAVVYGDMAYLPYLAFPEVAHFGGHTFVVFGVDEIKDTVYIYDRAKNPVTVSTSDLAKARGSKFPPFPPQHRLLKITYPPQRSNLEESIRVSIEDCCQNMLHPPISNIGLAGMEKWAKIVVKWPVQFQGINLLGALINGFIYIEIGGTGGSAFRPMYARFLEEASSIINKPSLKDVAKMLLASAKIWSEIAAGLLPDTCPNLKAMRELMFEKNRLFEEQAPKALEEMIKINTQIDKLMVESVADLDKAPSFLTDVHRSIKQCYEIECHAFHKLNSIITSS